MFFFFRNLKYIGNKNMPHRHALNAIYLFISSKTRKKGNNFVVKNVYNFQF